MRRAASTPPELPGYTFVSLLGSGGFADVFLYEQKLPRRRVAVKVLLVDEHLSAAGRAAFVAEANLMAQLSAHPYIVTIHHADVAGDDRPYFVMEYCSGPSLAQRYKQQPLSVEDVLRTGVRLSSAVGTAHAAGILHRDIKPANVLSNDYGWPALTDFGISTADGDDVLGGLTMTVGRPDDTASTGQAIGMSVPWSPPEMFDDDPQPDVRSDVFSLAATLYTVLAGHSPFEVPGRANGTLDLIARIERGAITPLARTDVPRSLLAVLHKGMAGSRDDRFVSAVDFARALQRVELELGYAATPIDVPQLAVHDAQPGAQDADETRARNVATVEAQPIDADETRARATPSIEAQPGAGSAWAPPPSATPWSNAPSVESVPPPAPRVQPAPSASSATPAPSAGFAPAAPSAAFAPPTHGVEERTVVRRREPDPVPPPPAAGPAPAPVADSAPRRRGRLVLGGVLAALGVLIVTAVVLGVVFFAPPPPEDPAPSAAPGDAPSVVVEVVPTPILQAPSLDGADLVFGVSNPAPEDGDTFQWTLSRRGEQPVRSLGEGPIRVTGVDQNQTTCIEAWVVRAGRTSERVEECYG